ncbi:MAG: hypothetical protein AAFR87_01435 [Bacteroidota bacterium]
MAKKDTYTPDPERIQLYLSGNMPKADQLVFENEIDNIPLLREAVQEAALAKWTIHAYANKEEMKALNKLYENNARTARVINSMHYRWMAVAAVIGLLLVAYFVFKPASVKNMEQIFASYYEIPASPDIMAIDTEEALRKADKAFGEKDWNAAIEAYGQIHEDSISSFQLSRIAFFKGISYMELGNWDQAENSLLGADQHPEQSQWYLAMLALKQGEQEKAKERLASISSNSDHYYAAQAKSLLDELEHLKE